MVDVKSRRCSEQNCDKYPAFNYPDETLSKFCGIHRKDGMIDVHNKRCLVDNCNTRPSFNLPGAPCRKTLQGLTLQDQDASQACQEAVAAAPSRTDLGHPPPQPQQQLKHQNCGPPQMSRTSGALRTTAQRPQHTLLSCSWPKLPLLLTAAD